MAVNDKSKKKTKAFRLTADEIKKMEKAAKELNRSQSYIVRSALDYFFDELIENEIALERLNDPTDEIISGDEMLKRISDDK